LAEVPAQVFRDQPNPFLAADECFQRDPLGLELLLAVLFFPFGDFLELGIDLGESASFRLSLAMRLS